MTKLLLERSVLLTLLVSPSRPICNFSKTLALAAPGSLPMVSSLTAQPDTWNVHLFISQLIDFDISACSSVFVKTPSSVGFRLLYAQGCSSSPLPNIVSWY